MEEQTLPSPAVDPAPDRSDFRDLLFDWMEMFAVSLAVLLTVLTFFFRYVPVQGFSMQNTLQDKDLLLISDFLYTPKSGDIVVVQSKVYGYDTPLVKRVIAVGGQTVQIRYDTWEVTVDGKKLDESYVLREPGMMHGTDYLETENRISTFTVEEGKLFVMGDHRNDSLDSRRRQVGMIDARNVVGKVRLRLFPFRSFGVVR